MPPKWVSHEGWGTPGGVQLHIHLTQAPISCTCEWREVSRSKFEIQSKKRSAAKLGGDQYEVGLSGIRTTLELTVLGEFIEGNPLSAEPIQKGLNQELSLEFTQNWIGPNSLGNENLKPHFLGQLFWRQINLRSILPLLWETGFCHNACLDQFVFGPILLLKGHRLTPATRAAACSIILSFASRRLSYKLVTASTAKFAAIGTHLTATSSADAPLLSWLAL